MKTKIKRHGRSVISVILAISMLVSCMMVGIIATDAAYDNSERVGAIDKWVFKSYPGLNGVADWNETDMFSGATGSYIVDRGSNATSGTIYFLTAAYENSSNHWCTKSGNIPLNTETQLLWDTSNEMNVNVSKRYVTFKISSGNKLTISESDKDPRDYYIHHGTSDNQSDDWSDAGDLIDDTTGYDFNLSANNTISFGINTSSTSKDNTVAVSLSYSPSSSFNYAETTTLNSRNAVRFKANVDGTYNVKFDGTTVTITGPNGGSTGTSNWYLRNGTYGWDSNGTGSEFIIPLQVTMKKRLLLVMATTISA